MMNGSDKVHAVIVERCIVLIKILTVVTHDMMDVKCFLKTDIGN